MKRTLRSLEKPKQDVLKGKLVLTTDGGQINWLAIERAIDLASDFATLKGYRGTLELLSQYTRLRNGAVSVRNAAARYIDRIDARRFELKNRLIRRGGAKSHPVTLKDMGLTKRQSQNLDRRNSIPPDKRAAYFDECDRLAKDATEAGLLRLIEVPTRKAPPLPNGKFSLLYMDPPWEHEYQHARYSPPRLHYPVMDDSSIKSLPVRELAAKNCTLLLWCPACMEDRAHRVIESWGFTFRTTWIWHKADRKNLGHYGSSDHEVLVIAGKGSSTPTADPKTVYSVSSVQSFPRHGLKHSEKPDEYYEIIEKLWPDARKLELFARKPRVGWTSWGNEVKSAGEEASDGIQHQPA